MYIKIITFYLICLFVNIISALDIPANNKIEETPNQSNRQLNKVPKASNEVHENSREPSPEISEEHLIAKASVPEVKETVAPEPEIQHRDEIQREPVVAVRDEQPDNLKKQEVRHYDDKESATEDTKSPELNVQEWDEIQPDSSDIASGKSFENKMTHHKYEEHFPAKQSIKEVDEHPNSIEYEQEENNDKQEDKKLHQEPSREEPDRQMEIIGSTVDKASLQDEVFREVDERVDGGNSENVDSEPAMPINPIPTPTEEELEAERLFHEGFKKVNSSHHFKTIADGYQQLKSSAELGHSRAAVEIALAQLHGRYLPMDINQAKTTLETEAEKGSPQAQSGLAFLYGTGISTNSSQAKALIYLTFAALGGDQMGRMMLAYRYWAGIGVPQNCESSLSYYRKVANDVAARVTMSGGVMIHRIRILDELESSGVKTGKVDEDLVQYYQFLADKGDVQAQVGLGQLNYQGGRGFEQNIQKAFDYFTLAANANNANAQAYLGKMYVEGSEEIEQDDAMALKYFQKAANQGNPVGQAGLGTMYLHGKGVKKDYNQAFTYFQSSADQGWVEGQLQLGNMYFLGLGIKRDYKQAARYFNLASQSGHLLAVYNLAQMHASGTGVPRSCHMAVELYKNVCERGRWSSLFDAAYHQYQSGRVDSALIIYLTLAELGYEVAQSNVGHILDQKESDILINQSYPRALVYWNRAASQGYTAARIKLGDYHYYGHGTEVDFETAAVHYKLASEQSNNAQAMFNLGYMHEQGLGLKKDFHLAKRFYDLAAEASADAQAPVMLALMKVGILYALEYIKEKQWTEMLDTSNLSDYISDDWDIYVMTVLALILGFIVAYRRQHVNRVPGQR